MINLAFYATGHGFGHFTRLMAVAGAFKTHKNVTIHVRSPFSYEKVLDALGFEPDSWKNVRLDLGLAQIDSLHHDLNKTIEQLEWYFGPEGNQLVQQEADELKTLGIDAAIIDISPRAFDVCKLAGIPAFASTNFAWDDIWKSYIDVEPQFDKFVKLASQSYQYSSLLFRTKMQLGLGNFSEVFDVPLIARKSQRKTEEILSLLKLPQDKPVVLIGFGGEGLRGMQLPDRSLLEQYTFIVSEPMENPGEGFYYIPGQEIAEKQLRYFDLVKMSDIAMIKPGYSMVAECVANQTAVLCTPRKDFIEAKAVTTYMEEKLPSAELPYEDLISGNWEKPLDKLRLKMPFEYKPVATNGADVVANKVMEILKAE